MSGCARRPAVQVPANAPAVDDLRVGQPLGVNEATGGNGVGQTQRVEACGNASASTISQLRRQPRRGQDTRRACRCCLVCTGSGMAPVLHSCLIRCITKHDERAASCLLPAAPLQALDRAATGSPAAHRSRRAESHPGKTGRPRRRSTAGPWSGQPANRTQQTRREDACKDVAARGTCRLALHMHSGKN